MKLLLLSFLLTVANIGMTQTWQDLAGGTNNSSHGMLVWNDQLINLGSFNSPCNRVASWDGANWNCLGGGVGIVARAGTVWQGKLVVVGDFWNVQQPCVGCNGVAVWDGSIWTPLGNGVNNDVLSVTVWNNQLVIAGDFTQADGVNVARIVKWNGTSWESVGPIGSFDNDIRTMTEFEGELWVGGDFNNVGGNPPSDGLVKYDPETGGWAGGNSGVDLVGGVNESVRVLYVNPNDGNLYMGGEFPELIDGDQTTEDFNMSGIAMYDGSNWTPLGTGLNEYCRAMHEYNGDLVVGGYFTDAGGTPANKIAKWDPVNSTWSAMGAGFDATGIDEYVKSATVWNGTFFAGGAYTQAEGNPMNFVSQWYEAPTSSPVAWINSSSTTICGNDCIDFLDNSTNAPNSWTWTFPGANIPTSSDQNPGSVCWSSEGTYDVTLEACNSIGCNTQSIEIVVGAGTVTVNDASVCDGASATLIADVSVTGGTYLWSPDGETTSSITVNPLSDQSYTVTYSLSGCSSSATSNVMVSSTPTINLNSSTPTICVGEAAVIDATPSLGGGTYIWLPNGEIDQSISVNPTATTTYSVVYTLNGCESNSESIDIFVNESPTISLNNETICEGEMVTLMPVVSQTGGSFSWMPNGETSATIDVSPVLNENFSVVYTLNGCESNSASSLVTVNQLPDASVSVTDNIITALAASADYAWVDCNNGNSLIIGENSMSYAPIENGSYALVVTSLEGCENTGSCEVISTIGIDEFHLSSLSLYPNPATETLTLNSTSSLENKTCYIIDAVGKVVHSITIDSSQKIDVSSLALGIYSIRIENRNCRFIKK